MLMDVCGFKMNEEEKKAEALVVWTFLIIVFVVTLLLSENIYTALMVSGLFFVGISVLYILGHYGRKKANRERLIYASEVYENYQKAIKGGDRREALRLGRDYYRLLREDGVLTLYDEQSIANDLSSMDCK